MASTVEVAPIHSAESDENTPLLAASRNQVPGEDGRQFICSPSLWAIIMLFLVGALTGGYLLYLQTCESPITEPFYLMRRQSWGSITSTPNGIPFRNGTKVVHVLITQTGNESCSQSRECSKLIQGIQKTDKTGDVPVNFLVGGDRRTYEGQGWRFQSPLNLSQFGDNVLLLSFIGDFTSTKPSESQLEEAKVWIWESIRRNFLLESYQIFGIRNSSRGPNDGEALFRTIQLWPKFNSTIALPL